MSLHKTLIVIPTYNEEENILEVYSRIREFSPQKHILFVDDNSTDRTKQLIEKIMEKDSLVDILSRQKKEGLARAYIAGFSWGLERDFQWFQQLDADLSHDPRYLPVFDSYKSKFDVIVASRYISQGTAKKWNIFRRIVSFFGCVYLKLLFGSSINDFTGGFNCWKREVLEKIDLSSIISKGFIFQFELKFAANKAGFKLIEFPYEFKEREKGSSKLSSDIIIEGLFKPFLIWLRYSRGG